MSLCDKALLYDVTRLVSRRRSTVPSGIDRIDAIFAAAVFERFPLDCYPIVQINSRTCLVDRDLIHRLIRQLTNTWSNGGDEQSSSIAIEIDRRGFASNAGYGPERIERHFLRSKSLPAQVKQILQKIIADISGRLFSPIALAATQHELADRALVYVNASHDGVIRRPGSLSSFCNGRPVRIAAYVHDLMPVELPQYTRTDQVASLHGLFTELLCYPTSFAANSAVTATSLVRYLSDHPATGRRVQLPTVIYPGVDAVQSQRYESSPTATKDIQPTFVMLGTIEPRKNHILILQIWRELVQSRCSPMPHLHIIGRRGWQIDHVTSMLDRCPEIQKFVTEHHDLNDTQVGVLLNRCRALLFPSFAEGFGLPLVEAAAAGVPVIASDIEVFREVLSGGVKFLDPIDGIGWRDAILSAIYSPELLTSPRLAPAIRSWQKQSQMFANFVEKVALEPELPMP